MLMRLAIALSATCLATFRLMAIGDVCEVCKLQIQDAVYLLKDAVADVKKPFCSKCVELTSVCYLCGLPVKDGMKELADGRMLCGRDSQAVVLDDSEALRICVETRDSLDRQFSRFLTVPSGEQIRFAIVDRVSLVNLFLTPGADYACPDVLGYHRSETKGTKVRHDISLMSGLLPGVLKSTIAHECMHAWIADNISTNRKATLGRDAEEGFCELLSYLLMGSMGEAAAQKKILSNAYTRGQIKLFIEAEQRFGLDDVVHWIQFGEDPQLIAGEVERVRRVTKPVAKVLATSGSTHSELSALPAPVSATTTPDGLTLQGIIRMGSRNLAVINQRTFQADEEGSFRLGGTNLTLRFLEIRTNSVLIRIKDSGEQIQLDLRAK